VSIEAPRAQPVATTGRQTAPATSVSQGPVAAPQTVAAQTAATTNVTRAETSLGAAATTATRAVTQEAQATQTAVPRETSLGVQAGNAAREVQGLGTQANREVQVERQELPALQAVTRAEQTLAPAATQAVRATTDETRATNTVVSREQALGAETQAVSREIESLGTVVHRVEGEPASASAPATVAAPGGVPNWGNLLVASMDAVKDKANTLATEGSATQTNAALDRLGGLTQTATVAETTAGSNLSMLRADTSVGDAHLSAIDAASRLGARSSDVRNGSSDIVNALDRVLAQLQVLAAKPTSSSTLMTIESLQVVANSPQQLQATLSQKARVGAISSNSFGGANLATSA
jgi:hypothetical protein